MFHVTNSLGEKKIAEYACNLGKECEVKDAGRKVKVTLYFNGPNLVMLETKGEEVVKKRFGVTEKGDTLELEVIPIGRRQARDAPFHARPECGGRAAAAK